MGGEQLKFYEYELVQSLKVLGWSVGSALVVFVIAFFASIDIEGSATWVGIAIPIINSALYSLKEWIADNREESI